MLKQINRDAVWKEIHTATLGEADRIITLPVSERIKTGMRLLAVSRENLRRIFILSYAYRMTGQEKYLVRAEQEMLKAASFSDWNPSHFLDVGEMTMALGVGYDWLYPALSEASRRTIREAIVKKGSSLHTTPLTTGSSMPSTTGIRSATEVWPSGRSPSPSRSRNGPKRLSTARSTKSGCRCVIMPRTEPIPKGPATGATALCSMYC
ncbi:MAG: hypothetical protein ACLTZY_06940 [Alistipes indistinctus]